ncbi:MAG: hypothetical protein K2V38_11115 [Gemmataceae bacterium]|nr:hypothetical protein [Gemmataceae bacterium]
MPAYSVGCTGTAYAAPVYSGGCTGSTYMPASGGCHGSGASCHGGGFLGLRSGGGLFHKRNGCSGY